MSKPNILFLFNSSHYAVQPWIDDGRYNVISVDYDDTDHSGAHRDATGHRRLNVDLSKPYAVETLRQAYAPVLVVSFAPCTDLAVSGAAHFKRKAEANPFFQDEAVAMARLVEGFGCPYVVENPVSVLATKWRKPDMIWHPYEFSGYVHGPHPEFPEVIPAYDAYAKKTCIWTSGVNLPEKRVTHTPETKDSPLHTKLGGKSARTKYIRSLTPRGFAMALYTANRGIGL